MDELDGGVPDYMWEQYIRHLDKVTASTARRFGGQLGDTDIKKCVDGCFDRMVEREREVPGLYADYHPARFRGYWRRGSERRAIDQLRRYRGTAPAELPSVDCIGVVDDIDGRLDAAERYGAEAVDAIERVEAGRPVAWRHVAAIEALLTGDHPELAAVLPPLPAGDAAVWMRVVLLARGITNAVEVEVVAWWLLGYPHEVAAVRTGRSAEAVRQRLRRCRVREPWIDDLKEKCSRHQAPPE